MPPGAVAVVTLAKANPKAVSVLQEFPSCHCHSSVLGWIRLCCGRAQLFELCLSPRFSCNKCPFLHHCCVGAVTCAGQGGHAGLPRKAKGSFIAVLGCSAAPLTKGLRGCSPEQLFTARAGDRKQ